MDNNKVIKNRRGLMLILSSPSGAGKTTIARAFINHFTKNDKIISPTFPMLITYEYKNNIIWHYDMYRLNNPSDVWNLSLEEALNNGIILIEWPEIIETLLPVHYVEVRISKPEPGSQQRNIQTKMV